MCDNLRKVTFRLGRYEYCPDLSPERIAEMEEYTRERHGYFHRWVEDVDTSKDIPYVKTMALVEDVEDGKVHTIETSNMQFDR